MALKTGWLVGPAVHHTRQEFSDSVFNMHSGGSFHIHGILVSNATASDATVDLTDNDANIILTFSVPARSSVKYIIPFYVENGLNIELISPALPNAAISVSFFHCGLMEPTNR